MKNKKYYTVGTVPKYYTVGTVPKYYTVGTVPKFQGLNVSFCRDYLLICKG
jgi:hypothetical protein